MNFFNGGRVAKILIAALIGAMIFGAGSAQTSDTPAENEFGNGTNVTFEPNCDNLWRSQGSCQVLPDVSIKDNQQGAETDILFEQNMR